MKLANIYTHGIIYYVQMYAYMKIATTYLP